MPRAAGGRKSCSSGALPTGKCECRLASSDEAPAEGVKVGEVRCASSRRVLIVRVMNRPAFVIALPWTAGAAMRSPMVDDNPFRGKQYLISSCDSLPEPSFVPQIKSTENGLRHRRTKVMRAALSALAARTSPNFVLSLGGRRHGYSGCGLAAGPPAFRPPIYRVLFVLGFIEC